jgi:aminopeptidase N
MESKQQPVEVTEPIDAVEIATPNRGPYRAAYTKLNDLVHTRLDVRFDWDNQYLLGTALLELSPHFYPQEMLTLDAKGFEIHSINLVDGENKTNLEFNYDGKKLNIKLDHTYQRNESYFVEIKYTAKPNELESGGSEAITSDKGLYFINPHGEVEGKPQQIWTQGETEASSCWFPTIDSPNQRTTQEIYITVDDKFTTLSNGQLVYSTGNNDGTRTDYWKMDQSHAPYLFMMAIGEFSIVKDEWQGKEVSYYVEPEYERYARAIFGKTPAMMTYFSELLKYPYPWHKYAQVVVRDYVSGAMENTTASVFMEALQVDSRYLIDDNWDGIIAHELFHHWFGDLVTSESWSNLTLNEAFATYSEYLWAEHLLGKDEADYLGRQEAGDYLQESETKKVDLVRFYYDDKEDMFDSHSYAKGSRVLHMLRTYLGDQAFFETLHDYLKNNADQPVEVHHLRLAAEEISGEDLNWFFNQWFFDSGHPILKIDSEYGNDTLTIAITQIQEPGTAPTYKLPIDLAIWQAQEQILESLILENQYQQFKFKMDFEPSAIVVDPDNKLLAEIRHDQSKAELIHQYNMSTQAITRLKSLEKLLEDSVDTEVVQVFFNALEDPFWAVRQMAVEAFEGYPGEANELLLSRLKKIANSDPKSLVRADAITTLSSFSDDHAFLSLYQEAMKDSSYAVAGAGLSAYLQMDIPERAEVALAFESETNMQLVIPLADYYALDHVPGKYEWFQNKLEESSGELLYYLVNYFGQYLVDSEPMEQITGAKQLQDMGLNHNTYYIRYAAFQALHLLEGVEGVDQMKKRVKESETDPRLVEVYAQFP